MPKKKVEEIKEIVKVEKKEPKQFLLIDSHKNAKLLTNGEMWQVQNPYGSVMSQGNADSMKKLFHELKRF
jgi:hypothetical protein